MYCLPLQVNFITYQHDTTAHKGANRVQGFVFVSWCCIHWPCLVTFRWLTCLRSTTWWYVYITLPRFHVWEAVFVCRSMTCICYYQVHYLVFIFTHGEHLCCARVIVVFDFYACHPWLMMPIGEQGGWCNLTLGHNSVLAYQPTAYSTRNFVCMTDPCGFFHTVLHLIFCRSYGPCHAWVFFSDCVFVGFVVLCFLYIYLFLYWCLYSATRLQLFSVTPWLF